MAIFLTSDTHFNHANIMGYCNRPWATVDDMNLALIDHWNYTVGPEDVVFHLGDFALGKQEEAGEIFDLLNGQKHLIAGNHDGGKVKALPWASVSPENMLFCDLGKFYMVHNPAAAKASLAPITVLHGHLHGQGDLHPFTRHPHIRYVDVGVDCWEYKPVPLAKIAA